MGSYPVPAEEIRREMIVVNSRFIATLTPAFSLEEAKEFINRIRSEFSDASHNVSIYLIGHGNSVIAHSTDDGEPSGTAGRPALAVLQGSNLGDVAVVITRYFGGTKLGTGGLVRAYGDSVRMVVEAVPRAEKVLTHTVMFDIPYRLLERIRIITARHKGTILGEDFAGEVTLTIRLAIENLSQFQEALKEATNGSIQAEIIETQETLMPIRGSNGE